MFRTAALAKRKGVAIGAHPGFNDLAGFGRRVDPRHIPAEIERMVAYQIGAMQAVAALGGPSGHLRESAWRAQQHGERGR